MTAKRLSLFITGLNSSKDLPDVDAPHPPRSPRRMSSPSASRSRSPGNLLRKALPTSSHSRAASGPPTEPSLHDLKLGLADESAPSPLQPPPSVNAAGSCPKSSHAGRSSRPSTPSSMSYSRPSTPSLVIPGQAPMTPKSGDEKQKRRGSWFGGKSKRDKEQDRGPVAWIAEHPQELPYDVDSLLNARPEIELCDHTDGNCFVYLWPKSSGKGASFKVDSAIFGASPVLTRLAFGGIYSSNFGSTGEDRQRIPLDAWAQGLSVNDPSTPPLTPMRNGDNTSSTSSGGSRARMSNLSDSTQETNLYLPVKLSGDASSTDSNGDKAVLSDDQQKLIDIRNLFAFLCGQSLVATKRKESLFEIFMTISNLLKSYEFSNVDGSTFGEVASSSFENYVEELRLADVRSSAEKIIEGIVLGEHMRSVLLYNEAFTHGAGRYEDLLARRSPRYGLITQITQNRLVIASRDLGRRTAAIGEILNEFNFPSLFSGIMNSKMSEERKEGVRFEAWKDSFMGTRKYISGLLAHRYGHWPPKAKSKKNDLETSGLNRLVLLQLYKDMSSLYDLLVDRTSLTTRTVDGVNLAGGKEDPMIRALHAVLSEYDRSSPPVKPPVPFDIPRIPTLKTTRPDFGNGDQRHDAKAAAKKLKDDEIAKILSASWNDGAVLTPFVDAFRNLEKRASHGCNIGELQELRIGQWIFIYVILQALPMLAIDAPGIKHNEGVEYFLCEPPRSGVPWANFAAASGAAGGRTWFSIGDGGGVVSLPSDLVEHGVEGIYRRSHCWQMAEKWTASNPTLNGALREQEALDSSSARPSTHNNDFLPPPAVAGGTSGFLVPGSPASQDRKRGSFIGLGLEALPLPAGVMPDRGLGADGGSFARSASPGLRPMTPVHSVDTSKTFDSILADVGGQTKVKKGKK